MSITRLKAHATFSGLTEFWQHDSRATQTAMRFAAFRPSRPIIGALIWLSGLACNEENFIIKAGAQRWAEELGLFLICPDTSPRGLQLPLEHDSWDFGSGASFYLDAQTPGYRDHYRMETYLCDELPELLVREFALSTNALAISGHSMGGHGALTLGLRHPDLFRSVSAFSPIVNPGRAPWGEKAFTGYLGKDRKIWAEHDATELILNGHRHDQPILIEQGLKDEFYTTQLHTAAFVDACARMGQRVDVLLHPTYDHSYYFIATYIESHLRFHAESLQA